ncbi:YceI family protein [bacterium]|nr:YceI family protein [bacterium]MDB4025221.1 YceI family protein [Flavobacteriaceae bacterium]MDA9295081.1 YceI family protein [bacterium]MDB4227947.1 YceI family protein [Flavobacteriaceae bacterium]MDB4252445.1 YceI family protein [Flavobacteriaceae bacterium]
MKKVLIALVALSTILVSCNGEKKEKVVVSEEVTVEKTAIVTNVDLTTSMMTWKGTKPTGEHNGTVALKSGGLVVENGVLKEGEFVIDMSTIKNLDMAGSAGAGKIEAHLKNADFFDIAVYPTSTFVITSVLEVEANLAVTGNLTIKDVTKSITIPAKISSEDGVTTFTSALFNIDRADFNVKYGSKRWIEGLKDKFIDDLVEMSFVVKTIK